MWWQEVTDFTLAFGKCEKMKMVHNVCYFGICRTIFNDKSRIWPKLPTGFL